MVAAIRPPSRVHHAATFYLPWEKFKLTSRDAMTNILQRCFDKSFKCNTKKNSDLFTLALVAKEKKHSTRKC